MTMNPQPLDESGTLALARAQLTFEMRDFFDALFAGADTGGLAAPDLALIAERARATLLNGAPQVTLSDAGRFSLLTAVNEDRPFLFDSAVAAALAGGAHLRNVFHPMVALGGRKLSLIVFVIDPVSDEGARARLIAALEECFTAGALAVRDWRAMLARLRAARDGLAAQGPQGRDIEEDIAFLDWLADDHFTFLGAREYRLADDGMNGTLSAVEGSGLGVLSDPEARILGSNSTGPRPGLSAEVRTYLESNGPLIVSKSSSRSVVHRRVHMDYVGVKIYDRSGRFCGEHRFVGLFTSSAYAANPRQIPLLRRKLAAVTARIGLDPRSHDGKALAHILESYPRDELFQVSEAELADTALGITRLSGLPRTKLFLRFDRFDRFASALLFAPRDHMTAQSRERIHQILAKALNGRASAAEVGLDEGPLVRVHYIIGRNPGARPNVDLESLQAEITKALETWDDALIGALCAAHGEVEGPAMATRLAPDFPATYRGAFGAADAARDLDVLVALADQALKVRAAAWRKPDDEADVVRLKLYVLGEVLPLSQTLPMFENCGLTVIAEDAFPVSFRRDDARRHGMVLDFLMTCEDAADLARIRQPLEDVLHAVLAGAAENDGFNRLVMAADLSWRQAVILRAAAKYLRQAGFAFSLAYMQQALTKNPDVAGLLVELFLARTDPARAAAPKEVEQIEARIEAALNNVASLDDDRIIRRLRNVIRNILRTNYFQPAADGAPKPVLSFKLDSGKLDDLPAPRPWREIFVYSPEVEGVHLRFGRIARGGLRWSDRREDFRTEILGLVKAQQVKNAVIVPVGAKGGFFPKQMPANPTREQFMAVGISAYKTFIQSLLDITDNLDAHGKVIPPENVLRPDGDDPYLVVAADKGTATFSDIANGIAIEHNFWLGDAFASGGSKGYDHKKMGITARGAWEAVKRHFREIGRDIQKDDFTVIGVGDMSGDVFGNGMLLSRHIRLVAAFDHRHIFLDPNAPTEAAFVERERLFNLPRSSWDDYNKELIGKGGGVFARTCKEIPLSDAVKALIGSGKDSMSPPELINALLKAKTDLLWFGGIGTYIKAASQSHLDAGDRANDAVRINGGEVKALVVGEGANLGVTQLGRIEAARAGVRIDTDAVDNSAGVDTSDHEVNLKILLSGPSRRGELSDDKRDSLLAAMTDDVAGLVLADNYDQTLALSVAQHNGVHDLDADARLIADLEARGRLDRAVEFLPSPAELKKLGHNGAGLTRPELAVLLAYAKLDLDAELLESDLPSDPALHDLLITYFPPAVIEAFPAEADRHRLKKEIISTVLTNRLVNLAGPAFVLRMKELSGRSAADVARAFVIADAAFDLSALKHRIDGLDGKTKAEAQIALYAAIAEHLQRVTPALLAAQDQDIVAAIALYRGAVGALRARLNPPDGADEIAGEVGLLPALAIAPAIARLAAGAKADPARAATLYEAVGAKLGLERLRSLAAKLNLPEHWDRLAVRRLLDDLAAAQAALTARLLKAEQPGEEVLEDWAKANREALARMTDFLQAIEASGELSVAKLMLAASQIQNLA
ncbi:MAG: NAD-glutamate dehydrogenase [Alphaproteobacteria bacterium]|nr:NAD-glutamate dehydrogenase [Alphaproteobacteria bacterium]